MPISRESRFRVCSKDFFLTYPQCSLDKDRVLAHLKEMWDDPVHVLVSKESHQDGSPHLHAYVKFRARKDVRSADKFDIDAYHPNVQKPRNPAASKHYIKKDGDFVEYIAEGEDDLSGIFCRAKEMSRSEFLVYCMEKKIPGYYHSQVLATIDDEGERNTIREAPSISIVLPEGLSDEDYKQCIEQCKSFVISGPAGCGKTVFAKRVAAKPSLFVRHIDTLKHLTAEHRSIIFDDMDFTHIPVDARKNLLDRFDPQQIHRRYGVTSIAPDVEKIFTANRNPVLDGSEAAEDKEAIRRRMEFIDLYKRETPEDILRNSIQRRE